MKAPSEIVSPHILAALSAAGYRVVAVDGGRDDAREGDETAGGGVASSGVTGNGPGPDKAAPLSGPHRDELTGELRRTLGLFDGAMPISPKQAWDEAIAKVAALMEGACGQCEVRSAALGAERERADLAERVLGWLIGTDDDTHEPGDDSLIEFNGEGWNLWDDDAQEWVALPAESPAAVLLARLSRRWVGSAAADLLARLTGDQP